MVSRKTVVFSKEKVEADWFKDAYALHFCSVSLGDFPMKKAHKKAIEAATEAGAIISFDPNLRFALWKNLEDLKKAVLEFLPLPLSFHIPSGQFLLLSSRL